MKSPITLEKTLRYTIIAFIGVVLGFLLYYGIQYGSAESVTITLTNRDSQSVTFAIPRAYVDQPVGENSNLPFFYLRVVSPGMRPARISIFRPHQSSDHEFPLVLGVQQFESTVTVMPSERNNKPEWLRQKLDKLPHLASPRDSEQDFWLVEDREAGVEYLVPRDLKVDEWIAFRCWKHVNEFDERKRNFACISRFRYGDRLSVHYNLPRDAIPHGREINAQVKSLIKLLATECFDRSGEKTEKNRQLKPNECLP